MRWLLFIPVLLAAALLDSGNLLNIIALGGSHIRPVMLIIVLVFSCLNSRRNDAILCSFATGFAADIVSAAMGPHMIVYGIAGIILHSISHAMNMKRIPHQSLVIFVVFLLTQFPIAWLEMFKPGYDQIRTHLISNILGTALYTAVLTPVIWFVLTRIWAQIYPHTEGRIRRR